MSIHGECFDTGQAGNCGSQGCRMFQRGECSIPKEILENEAPSLSSREYLEICELYNISLEKPMNTTEANAVSGRVETKGLFRTAYYLGDTFWAMENNKPTEVSIDKMIVTITAKAIEVSYALAYVEEPNSHWANNCLEEKLPVARTRQELIDSL